MNLDERNAWKKKMMKDAGHWTVDPCHEAQDDFLAYVAEPEDPTRGIYLMIDGKTLSCGYFKDAVPHIGEAIFTPKVTLVTERPLEYAIERLGITFLLAVTHGTSPYRSS